METPDMKRPREAENNTLKASRNSGNEDDEKTNQQDPNLAIPAPRGAKKLP